MGQQERYENWLKRVKNRKLLGELADMSAEDIDSAFYRDLDFGTAGIRGVMGAGTNRINVYTVRKISQGVALYMKSHGMRKAVISYDSRINSADFAREAAAVFASAGFNAYITSELMPTPFLSYATRKLGADVGVMITASHNPREYNGYKVYDRTGCQLSEKDAAEVATYISKIDVFRLKTHSFDYYMARSLISYVSPEVEEQYLAEIRAICPGRAEGLNVVYTPLCGTGYRLVPKTLSDIGCKVSCVKEQATPSGKFATCPIPNPEKKEALKYGIRILKEVGADLLIATDPDADRIGVAFDDGRGIRILSGNEMGILMCDYLLSRTNVEDPVIVRTEVSTDLVDKMAAAHGATVVSVPTGFKFIGGVLNSLQAAGKEDRFLLGFEESQGYLVGSHVRDKDAVIASKIMALIASELKARGKNFADRLGEIYSTYGNFASKQFTYRFEGQEGEAKMKSLMASLRTRPLSEVAGNAVIEYRDYLQSGGDFPPADMLAFRYDCGKVIVRPSGTEPLIKVYAFSYLDESRNGRYFGSIDKQFGEIFV